MRLTPIHEYMESVDSTNDEIKRRAEGGASEGLVISAGLQKAGRGRSGREWEMRQKESVATSLLLRPDLPVENLPTLTLVAAMAVRRAIEVVCELETEIKWPNDLVKSGKKICGILTELSVKEGKAEYVVIGIGVNVHNEGFSPELTKTATSLDKERQALGWENLPSDTCEKLTNRIWQEFFLLYEVFCLTGDLRVLMEEYNRFLVNRNQQVRVLDLQEPWEGVARGIDATGELLVETKEDLRHVDAGEVSVRGVYGYV